MSRRGEHGHRYRHVVHPFQLARVALEATLGADLASRCAEERVEAWSCAPEVSVALSPPAVQQDVSSSLHVVKGLAENEDLGGPARPVT